jgi:hypothetical protein
MTVAMASSLTTLSSEVRYPLIRVISFTLAPITSTDLLHSIFRAVAWKYEAVKIAMYPTIGDWIIKGIHFSLKAIGGSLPSIDDMNGASL